MWPLSSIRANSELAYATQYSPRVAPGSSGARPDALQAVAVTPAQPNPVVPQATVEVERLRNEFQSAFKYFKAIMRSACGDSAADGCRLLCATHLAVVGFLRRLVSLKSALKASAAQRP